MKSELIVRGNATEEMFATHKGIIDGYPDSLRNTVVVAYPATTSEVTGLLGADAAARVEAYNRILKGCRCAAENDTASVALSGGVKCDTVSVVLIDGLKCDTVPAVLIRDANCETVSVVLIGGVKRDTVSAALTDSVENDTASAALTDSVECDTASAALTDSVENDTASAALTDSVENDTASAALTDSVECDTASAALTDSVKGGTASAVLTDSVKGGTASAVLTDSVKGGTASAVLTDSVKGGTASAVLTDGVELSTMKSASRWVTHLDLRANLLRWATATADIGVEWHLSPRWALAVDGSWCTWSWSDKRNRYALLEVIPAIHYYLDPNQRVHVGVMAKVGEFNYKFSSTGHQGDIVGGGVVGGFRLPINKRLTLDCNLGLGCLNAKFDSYNVVDGVRVFKSHKNKNWWGPIAAGVTLVWNVF